MTTTDRLSSLPSALRSQARLVRLGPTRVPALLAHPDWSRSAPVMLWPHARTVSKEIAPGRYLRWLRAGIATCALDLPGHGERAHEPLQSPAGTLDVIRTMLDELDGVVEALVSGDAAPNESEDPDRDGRSKAGGDKHGWNSGVFDPDRMGIGGMSAGGMVALRRLCDSHRFRAAAVEGTTGWLAELYHPTLDGNTGRPWDVEHPPERIEPLDPAAHLSGFETIPLLALHSESDSIVPFVGQRAFIEKLRERYRARDADPSLIEFRTWPETGAPSEHAGFGRYASDAKTIQTEFLARALDPDTR